MERDNYYELTIDVDKKYIDFLADSIANISDGVEISSRGIIVRAEDNISKIRDEIDNCYSIVRFRYQC